MIWHIEWTDRALKDAGRLDRPIRERVLAGLERLAETGYGDIKRLESEGKRWRLRVGDWRIRFTFEPETHTIWVLRVLPRGRAYR